MNNIKSLLLVALPIAAVLLYFAARLAARLRRRRLMAEPFPDAWRLILERNLPVSTKLPPALRARLHGLINVFLAEKNFEGCGGLELNDEIRVTIAAQACLLLLNHTTCCYPRLRSILVYPHTYKAETNTGESVRLGESWSSGVVVLSWNSVRSGVSNFEDGHNVTFHEFAHQLDQEDGVADGAPPLERISCYASWARVFNREYKRLITRSRKGRRTVMDRYGATNPAEFFAVATETFFEKPKQMAQKHPELYEEIKSYYDLDPLGWED
jgi:Mlc titration factor MtfA (ptsG expression regulator)